jgi:hypothetical protein
LGEREHGDSTKNRDVPSVLVQPPGRTSRAQRRGSLWHFVPDDWTIKDSHRTLALGLLLDVEAQAQMFREHEFSPPRSDADRAFSGWLRRAPEFMRRTGSAGAVHPLVERSMRIINGSKINGAP